MSGSPRPRRQGPEVTSIVSASLFCSPHCGDRARPDPPAHQPLPPTPAQLSGQKVGWATGLGWQSREEAGPQNKCHGVSMGAEGSPCQGQVPGGSRWSGVGAAKSPAGGNPGWTLPSMASGLSCVQVEAGSGAYPQVGRGGMREETGWEPLVGLMVLHSAAGE